MVEKIKDYVGIPKNTIYVSSKKPMISAFTALKGLNGRAVGIEFGCFRW